MLQRKIDSSLDLSDLTIKEKILKTFREPWELLLKDLKDYKKVWLLGSKIYKKLKVSQDFMLQCDSSPLFLLAVCLVLQYRRWSRELTGKLDY